MPLCTNVNRSRSSHSKTHCSRTCVAWSHPSTNGGWVTLSSHNSRGWNTDTDACHVWPPVAGIVSNDVATRLQQAGSNVGYNEHKSNHRPLSKYSTLLVLSGPSPAPSIVWSKNPRRSKRQELADNPMQNDRRFTKAINISSRWPKFTLNRHDIGDYGVNNTSSLLHKFGLECVRCALRAFLKPEIFWLRPQGP